MPSAGGMARRQLSVGSGLAGYDEATHLDAEALFGPTASVPSVVPSAVRASAQHAAQQAPGPPALTRRPSDPVGEQSRRSRVLYHYR